MRWTNRQTLLAFRMLVDGFGDELKDVIADARAELSQQLGRDPVGQEFLLFFAGGVCQCLANAEEGIKRDPKPDRRALGLRKLRRLLDTADWRQVGQRLLLHHAEGPWPPHRKENCWCWKPMSTWVTASKRLHEAGHGWPGFSS